MTLELRASRSRESVPSGSRSRRSRLSGGHSRRSVPSRTRIQEHRRALPIGHALGAQRALPVAFLYCATAYQGYPVAAESARSPSTACGWCLLAGTMQEPAATASRVDNKNWHHAQHPGRPHARSVSSTTRRDCLEGSGPTCDHRPSRQDRHAVFALRRWGLRCVAGATRKPAEPAEGRAEVTQGRWFLAR